MNGQDLELIEKLLTRKLDEQKRDLTHTVEELIEASERRTGVLLERLEQKVDVVIEGQQALVERMDRMELRQKEDY